MRRLITCAVFLLAAVASSAGKAPSRPLPQPLGTAATSDAVVVGTITAVEDDPVKAKPHPDAPDALSYRVLVVKVDDAVLGVKNTTHVRVAIPAGDYQRADQSLQPDGKFLFYLMKHPTTEWLTPNPHQQPVNLADKSAGEFVRRAKLVGAAVKDPTSALKAMEKDDRVLAAVGLVAYYRRHAGGTHETADRPADESKLILEALAEGDWRSGLSPEAGGVFGVVRGMNLEDSGWRPLPNPGQQNPAGEEQAAFKKWLADKGKDARVKQFVPK